MSTVIVAAIYTIIGIIGIIGIVTGGLVGNAVAANKMLFGGGILGIFKVMLAGGLGGFLSGLVGAFAYNLAARIVGGVVIELKDT